MIRLPDPEKLILSTFLALSFSLSQHEDQDHLKIALMTAGLDAITTRVPGEA